MVLEEELEVLEQLDLVVKVAKPGALKGLRETLPKGLLAQVLVVRGLD